MNDYLPYLIPLLAAHFFTDFLLQPRRWVLHKERRKHRSLFLYLHSLIAGFLAYLLLGAWHWWPVLVVTALSHGLIDLAKLHLQQLPKMPHLFFYDQLSHLAVVGLLSLVAFHEGVPAPAYSTHFISIYGLTLYLLTVPVGMSVKAFFQATQLSLQATEELSGAGRWIGYFERLLLFFLVLQGEYIAIGFLITAKSIIRFDQTQDRAHSEYVLLGTLISFSAAFGLAYAAQPLL
jgi:hypothetical protein